MQQGSDTKQDDSIEKGDGQTVDETERQSDLNGETVSILLG